MTRVVLWVLRPFIRLLAEIVVRFERDRMELLNPPLRVIGLARLPKTYARTPSAASADSAG